MNNFETDKSTKEILHDVEKSSAFIRLHTEAMNIHRDIDRVINELETILGPSAVLPLRAVSLRFVLAFKEQARAYLKSIGSKYEKEIKQTALSDEERDLLKGLEGL